MIDVHDQLGNTGVLPGLFGVSMYSLLVGLGLAAGILYIIRQNRRTKDPGEGGRIKSEQTLVIVAAALIFGTIGSKIPALLQGLTLENLLLSKSVVGGLIGGTAGVFLVKRFMQIKLRLGNTIAPAAALGLTIGRLGCFCNGCCAGIPASWGVDFGDGILRLPTQLFESAFQLAAFFLLHFLQAKVKTPGILFKGYVLAYFSFRFFLEFIRVNPIYWNGLTVYQLLCLAGIAWMGLMLLLPRRRRTESIKPKTDILNRGA